MYAKNFVKYFIHTHCRRLCKTTEIFLTIENVFFYLIYIDIYIDTYISGPLRSSFDLSCTDELSRSETAAVYRSTSIVYIYIYFFFIYIYKYKNINTYIG